MKTEDLEMIELIPASPERIFKAWLDGREHGVMTGGGAVSEPRIGTTFSAWDGYISGRTIELEPFRRIVQNWRTTEFPKGFPDSRLSITLDAAPGGTQLTLVHRGVPASQAADYRKGWISFYFKPMKKHFAEVSRRDAEAAERRNPIYKPPPEPRAKRRKKPAKKKRAAASRRRKR